MSFLDARRNYFIELFKKEWQDKAIWEHIRDKKLSATPAFEGELYRTAETKIMIVGRALNGWEANYADCSSLESTVESVLIQDGAFDTFVGNPCKSDCSGKRAYNHKHSKFFRFIKSILENLGESDEGMDATWECDSKKWNHKFVWTNLYCISPRCPKSGENPNPTNRMIKPSINTYVDLMKLYIEFYKPDAVVFVTDIVGWFEIWPNQKSFKNIVDNYNECNIDDTIVATGNLGESKIIVCKRPDKFGLSYDDVTKMAVAIANYIKQPTKRM